MLNNNNHNNKIDEFAQCREERKKKTPRRSRTRELIALARHHDTFLARLKCDDEETLYKNATTT